MTFFDYCAAVDRAVRPVVRYDWRPKIHKLALASRLLMSRILFQEQGLAASVQPPFSLWLFDMLFFLRRELKVLSGAGAVKVHTTLLHFCSSPTY